MLGQFSKSKGHNSAKSHWIGTKCKRDMYLITIHSYAKIQINISKHSEKQVVTTVLFRYYEHGQHYISQPLSGRDIKINIGYYNAERYKYPPNEQYKY